MKGNEKTGNLSEAMDHAKELMAQNPSQALLQLTEILDSVLDYPPARPNVMPYSSRAAGLLSDS